MGNYLLAIGWWNFVGSVLMLGMLYQPFGKKMLNEWCRIFKPEFALDYWGKLWFGWAAGLNVFFGLINILSVHWAYPEIMRFLVWTDIVAYSIFVGLTIWGVTAGRMGSGVYAVFIIFGFWIGCGFWVLM